MLPGGGPDVGPVRLHPRLRDEAAVVGAGEGDVEMCFSNRSLTWIQKFPVDSTTALTSSPICGELDANSSMSSFVFMNLVSSSSVSSSSRTATGHIFLWTSIPTDSFSLPSQVVV